MCSSCHIKINAMKKYHLILLFLLSSGSVCSGQHPVAMPGSEEKDSERRLIPIKVAGWKVVFEMNKNDNPDASGIIVYHLILDKNGNILDIQPQKSNVSKEVEKIYREKIISTWQVIGYDGANPPEITEGNYDLHVTPLK
jgi:hypothetical protein